VDHFPSAEISGESTGVAWNFLKIVVVLLLFCCCFVVVLLLFCCCFVVGDLKKKISTEVSLKFS